MFLTGRFWPSLRPAKAANPVIVDSHLRISAVIDHADMPVSVKWRRVQLRTPFWRHRQDGSARPGPPKRDPQFAVQAGMAAAQPNRRRRFRVLNPADPASVAAGGLWTHRDAGRPVWCGLGRSSRQSGCRAGRRHGAHRPRAKAGHPERQSDHGHSRQADPETARASEHSGRRCRTSAAGLVMKTVRTAI